MEVEPNINVSADERNNREEPTQYCHSGRSKIFGLVGISFVLLCIIQSILNATLRLQTDECFNRTDNSSTNIFIRDLILERDELLQERNQLLQERDKLNQEKDKLSQEKDRLLQERDKLSQEKDRLLQERDKLSQKKDQLLQEKDKLSQEKDRLLQEKDKLSQEKKRLLRENNQLLQEKNKLSQEKDQLLQERDKLNQEKDQLLQERDKLNQEKDQLTQKMRRLEDSNRQLTTDNNMLNEKISKLDRRIEELERKEIGSPNTQRCPLGWQAYMSSCYQFSSSVNTWNYASRDCELKGAHLVTFSNGMEEEVVRAFGNYLKMWVGLEGPQHTLTWTWVDGSPLTYECPIQGSGCGYVDPFFRPALFLGYCYELKYWMCEKDRF